MRSMFRKGPAKLHAFGSGDFEEFKVSDLSLKNQKAGIELDEAKLKVDEIISLSLAPRRR